MTELMVLEHKGQAVADSRGVAEFIGRSHFHLMRSIKTYCRHLGESKNAFSSFFIPATYQSEQGKEMPCYYLTRLGCDMVANKMT